MALRVLIVDDEADARDNLRLMLEEHCPEVQIAGQAGSAPEARQMIQELQPNGLFLDIKMPGEDGFSLLASVAELDLPVPCRPSSRTHWTTWRNPSTPMNSNVR
jgi:two-component system, LytTR family, response regulator